MKRALIAVFVCVGCGGDAGAPPVVPLALPTPPATSATSPAAAASAPQQTSSAGIRIVPLELVITDKSESGPHRLELHADGSVHIDGERRAEVKDSIIVSDAAEISLLPGGRVALKLSHQGNAPRQLHFSAEGDLLDPRGEGLHIDANGEVFGVRRKKREKYGYFVAVPEGGHNTAVLMVLTAILYGKQAEAASAP